MNASAMRRGSSGSGRHVDCAAQRMSAVFLFDLIQDVSVLRPIIRTLAAETNLSLSFLVSHMFERRDRAAIWRAELGELATMVDADIARFDCPLAAMLQLQGKSGLLFSASESNLPAHLVNHQVFLAAPVDFTRITVQHGHECVGFNQNREQSRAHGIAVRFAADILCGWVPVDHLRHLLISERDKYYELGPPQLLNRLYDLSGARGDSGVGLVCENLHSVRMQAAEGVQSQYLDTAKAFFEVQLQRRCKVALRPHPGGQFVLKNAVALPDNVVLANKPLFKTDLQRFAFGISAPSSVLIDMVMADIPTAVWRDVGQAIDVSGYAGLARVSTLDQWLAFAEVATRDPAPFIALQHNFLRRSALDSAPEQVAERLLRLVDGLLMSRAA